MCQEFNVINEPFAWYPSSYYWMYGRCYGYDLFIFEGHLWDYVCAIGLLLSLLVPKDTVLGPVGGGRSNHPIFEIYSIEENRVPVIYISVKELINHINELLVTRVISDDEFVDFSNESLCYIPSNLNNANVMFYDGEIYLIDHLDEHLIKHLKLPYDNYEGLTCVQGTFWPEEGG
ncbi:hypothetical protein EAF04_007444 [Stromatinia cepivora]|nr:hypothetical protein EAF04_007444 [Stromatinia cepivora]